jgi:hypothetical protein
MLNDSIRQRRRAMTLWPGILLLAAPALLVSCAGPAQPVGEASASNTPRLEQTAPAPSPQKQEAPPAAPPAATLDAAQGAVARVYKDAVVFNKDSRVPFVVGDFNGDGSQDIAVVVSPAKGRLAAINSEFAGWIVTDPQRVVPPEMRGDAKVFPKRPEPVKVREGDTLLAVIHGYRKDGWRDPLSSQTFLLKNAYGGEMRVEPAGGALGGTLRREQLPALRGDVIRERLAGEDGFVYWTGSNYAWFHPAELR